ncbi:hypothetical protein jhhlp_003483 [Lomentospora prolificans]|uniref:Amino-acid acetyltransferase, mitochondrial n=1 Tax=Lomentospora prolificans TaxID=41688 RepID=A0A2N3N8V5_9PEZI|nr:hypothetical protein jhhlp_003483 [Lomentospora prolificans]
MAGVARTLSQLRTLGLVSVIVLDCGRQSTIQMSYEQASRLMILLGRFDKQQTVVLEHDAVFDTNSPTLLQLLRAGKIPVINEYLYSQDTCRVEKTHPESTVVTLTRLLGGHSHPYDKDGPYDVKRPSPALANIESIIVLDPVGGIPMAGGAIVPHRFVNLQQEYWTILANLTQGNLPKSPEAPMRDIFESHRQNLTTVNAALSILPPTASALIASPLLAATTARPEAVPQDTTSTNLPYAGFATVKTRPTKNPLIHNLLTDKPVYSPSLPVEKFAKKDLAGKYEARAEIATLVKRGMPVTVLGVDGLRPGQPSISGTHRLRLTDDQVNLPKLVHLIEDSFNRKLDVDKYLQRVNHKLAGLVIAGDYEGVAILTWETPSSLSEKEAYRQGRLVPYLDKFAVLKARQGSGGVADIVFNAMVQDCFPQGVCWRSRANNPVNKWYFERSVGGTKKLRGTQWVMFWTTGGLQARSEVLADFEDVCRQIQPSWAD